MTKKTPTPAQALATASKAAEDAAAALDTARTERATIADRIAQGDASVTAADIVAADAEVTLREGLAAATARALAAAEADHRSALAVATATGLAQTAKPESLDSDVAAAASKITTALRALRAAGEKRNAAVQEAVTAAREAGLVVGSCDPLSPVAVTADALVIEGEAVPLSVDVEALLVEALRQAGSL